MKFAFKKNKFQLWSVYIFGIFKQNEASILNDRE